MESWRLVWRDGFVPVISTAGLESPAGCVAGRRSAAHAGQHHHPAPASCACRTGRSKPPVPSATAAGRAIDLDTVGEVEEFFARVCFEADQRLGEPAACRWFLNWFDDTPRDEMRRELLDRGRAGDRPEAPDRPRRPENQGDPRQREWGHGRVTDR